MNAIRHTWRMLIVDTDAGQFWTQTLETPDPGVKNSRAIVSFARGRAPGKTTGHQHKRKKLVKKVEIPTPLRSIVGVASLGCRLYGRGVA